MKANGLPALILACLLLLCVSCGGGATTTGLDQDSGPGSPVLSGPVPTGQPAGGTFPSTLPEDSRKPWEQLDGSGLVIPHYNDYFTGERASSAINETSEFMLGVDRDDASGPVSDVDQASRLDSSPVASSALALAQYRLPLGGDEPGVVSIDANLHPRSDGSASEYYVGLSDYGKSRWEWHGPFTDSHVRLSVPDGDFTSTLGSLFVAVAAFDGSYVDVVGVGANTRDGGDTTAPTAPAALAVTPMQGALLLEWTPSAAADLAGYQVYWSYSPITDTSAGNVHAVPYLQGSTSYVLAEPTQALHVYVRVTAVDTSGNESVPSAEDSGFFIVGSQPELVVETDTISGLIGAPANITASGAATYDWDIDGDGVFDITGDTTGTILADTNSTGVIRPAVRGYGTGGTSFAQGAVSLIIMASVPPVAILELDKMGGMIWEGESLSVTGDAGDSYDDQPGLQYAYDQTGEGAFTSFSTNTTKLYQYDAPGVYQFTVRVLDADGLVDYASKLVTVKKVDGFDTDHVDFAASSGQMSDLAIVNGLPAMVVVRPAPPAGLMFYRAVDSNADYWDEPVIIPTVTPNVSYPELEVINGRPAVFYYDGGPSEYHYIRATDANGDTWSNVPVSLDNVGGLGYRASMREVAGQPAIAYEKNGDLRYMRATANSGDTPADWGNLPFEIDSSGNVSSFCSLAIVGGNPAIAYYHTAAGDVRFTRATNTTGALLANWPAPLVVSGAAVVGGYIALAEVNGNPAVTWLDTTGPTAIAYQRAFTTNAMNAGDWPAGAELLAEGYNPVGFSDLKVIDGKPVIVYGFSAGNIGNAILRARDADGTAWETSRLVYSQFGAAVGYYNTLVEYQGMPWIGHTNASFSLPMISKPNLEN